jgi:hypothetical protein
MHGRREFNGTRTTQKERLGGSDLYLSRRRLECGLGVKARPDLTFPIEMGNRYLPRFRVPDLGGTEKNKSGVDGRGNGLTPW